MANSLNCPRARSAMSVATNKKRIIALRVPETNTSASVVFISFTNKFSLNYVGRVACNIRSLPLSLPLPMHR